MKKNKKIEFDFKKVINEDLRTLITTNSLREDVTIPDYSDEQVILEQEQKALATASKLIPEITELVSEFSKKIKIAKLNLEKRYPDNAQYDVPDFVTEFYSILENIEKEITPNKHKLNELEFD